MRDEPHTNRSKPMREPQQQHVSSVLKAFRAGREQALSGAVYEPPLWIRNEPVPRRAFLTGYNDGLTIRRGHTAAR